MSSPEPARGRVPRPLMSRLRVPDASRKWVDAAIAGLGGFIVIFLFAHATTALDVLLLIPPFGASCVLVFGLPQVPVAQPQNVIGGHLVSTIAGLAVLYSLGATPLGFGLGVGLAIAAMLLTNTTHPPAGADPVLVLLAGATWHFLFVPILIGSVAIVLVGIAYHRLVTGKAYPHRA